VYVLHELVTLLSAELAKIVIRTTDTDIVVLRWKLPNIQQEMVTLFTIEDC